MAGRAFDPRTAGEPSFLRYALLGGVAMGAICGLLGYALAGGAVAFTGLGQWASGGVGVGTFAGAGVGFAAGALGGGLAALHRTPARGRRAAE